MKKRKLSNLIFVMLIICILAGGIFGAGLIRGWFDKPSDNSALLKAETGICTLIRDGISYPVNSTTVLRTGDKLTCQNGAVASIQSGEDQLILGETAAITIQNASNTALSLHVDSGSVFAHCENGASLSFLDKTIEIQKSTALLCVDKDRQTVSVFRGTVGQVQAGQQMQYAAETSSVETLALDSLSDFAVTQIRQLKNTVLCFTADDLDLLATQRQQEIQDLFNSQSTSTTSTETTSTETTPSQSTTSDTPATQPAATDSTTSQQPTKQETVPPETTTPIQDNSPSTPAAPVGKCNISIYCTTILNNMESLEPGKAEFVPSDGTILYPVTVDFYEGETVFDVLKRVCSTTGIQLEYSWTPLYNSYYVEGIHQLYEFDCGFESGWMYKVNGWFPNYGCSSYQLKEGDTIVWAYTCQGLGADLGAKMQ